MNEVDRLEKELREVFIVEGERGFPWYIVGKFEYNMGFQFKTLAICQNIYNAELVKGALDKLLSPPTT